MTHRPASFRDLANWHTEEADQLSRDDGQDGIARDPQARKEARTQAVTNHRRRAAELNAEADAHGES